MRRGEGVGGRKGCIRFWGRLDKKALVSLATESHHGLIMGERISPPFLDCFDPILFKLAGNKNMHTISNKFEFRPDRTTDYGVSCP